MFHNDFENIDFAIENYRFQYIEYHVLTLKSILIISLTHIQIMNSLFIHNLFSFQYDSKMSSVRLMSINKSNYV